MQQPEIPQPGVPAENINPAPAIATTPPAVTTATPIPPLPPVGKEKPGIWQPWPTVGLGIAIFAVNSLAQGIVALVYAISMLQNGYSLYDMGDFQSFARDLISNGQMLSLSILVSAVAGIGITILFIKIHKGFSIPNYLGLKAITLKTVLALLGVYVLALGLSILIGLLNHSTVESDIISDAYHNTPWPVVFWLAIVVFGPFFEEILFRGFLFVGLIRSGLGITGTIVVTGLVFALLHASQYGAAIIAQIFVLGIIFGIVRWKTDSLWSTIFLHGLWNLGQMIMLAFWPGMGS
jgi:uncharacterized protein